VTLDPFVRCAAKTARLTVESNTTHDLAVGCVFLCKKRTHEPTLTVERWFLSACYPNPKVLDVSMPDEDEGRCRKPHEQKQGDNP
jgi:hypothetical protein